MVFLLDLFSIDQGSTCERNDDLALAMEALNDMGMLPDPKLN